ncbi:hypothetical protein [Acetobacter tropicalis]|uniref:hypothetical protein n=1 Tax=Acetobacter tropicalis TaxID=104102 RepID=UPI00130511C8|nr:hypothetical protein [Acetobacter tropicalis]
MSILQRSPPHDPTTTFRLPDRYAHRRSLVYQTSEDMLFPQRPALPVRQGRAILCYVTS